MATEKEAKQEKAKETVITAASQAIGQGNVQKRKSFSSHVTIVVRKVIKQHSVRYPKEGEKEKASVRSAMKVIGLGNQVQKSVMRSGKTPQSKESIR